MAQHISHQVNSAQTTNVLNGVLQILDPQGSESEDSVVNAAVAVRLTFLSVLCEIYH